MPYNPGSAYPRQTTWTPPRRDLGAVRAVNAPSFVPVTTRGGVQFPGYGAAFSRHQASAYANSLRNVETATAVGQTMNRQGLMDQLQNQQREQAGLRQNRQRPRTPASTVNPNAAKQKEEAESIIENVASSVISSPKTGTETAALPQLIIPTWREGSRRRR